MPSIPFLGLIPKLFSWFADFAAMPGRVKALSQSAAADADPRLKCLSCGEGRVGRHRVLYESGAYPSTVAQCDHCRTWWTLRQRPEGALLNTPLGQNEIRENGLDQLDR